MEFVTNQQWLGYAKKLEGQTFKAHGKTLTARSIARRAAFSFVADVPQDHSLKSGMVVKSGWRKGMRDIAAEALKIMNQRQDYYAEALASPCPR